MPALIRPSSAWVGRIILGFVFILLNLPTIGFAKADDPNRSFAEAEHHQIQAIPDRPDRNKSRFAIVFTPVRANNGALPVEALCDIEPHTVLGHILR